MKRLVLIIGMIVLAAAVIYYYRFDIQNSAFRYIYKYFKEYRAEKQTTTTEKERILSIFEKYKDKPFGIDVSQYQGSIDFELIDSLYDAYPVKFIFIRATAGSNKVDNHFKHNWKKANEKKLIKGAYHYYRPNENSIKQADNFIEQVSLEKGDLPPVLDIEEMPQIQTMESLRKGLIKWLTKIEEHYGVKPILYTSEKYYLSHLNMADFKEYPLWIANYTNNNAPYTLSYKFWQFSDKGNMNGISENVDFNVFNGSINELKQLLIK